MEIYGSNEDKHLSNRVIKKLKDIPIDPSNLIHKFSANDGTEISVFSGADESPRNFSSPFGHMVFWNKTDRTSYTRGLSSIHDLFDLDIDEFLLIIRKFTSNQKLVMWIYTCGESLVAVESETDKEITPSATVGAIFVSEREQIGEKMTNEVAINHMKCEVEEYGNWIFGNCYGIEVVESSGESWWLDVYQDYKKFLASYGYLVPNETFSDLITNAKVISETETEVMVSHRQEGDSK